jgi:hypothetical protein
MVHALSRTAQGRAMAGLPPGNRLGYASKAGVAEKAFIVLRGKLARLEKS